MKRPHTICLMATSIDGKILGHTWGKSPAAKKLLSKFEETHEAIGIRAWIVGRTTMEKDFTHFENPIYEQGTDTIDRTDFIGNHNAASFAIALDEHAKLGWKSGTILGDHVITILSEKTDDTYLRHLRSVGVSYIFAGIESIDLEIALQKLYSKFGIEKLMVEGGGKLNGSFLDAGLIDQVFQLLLPVIDGKTDTSTFFEIDNEKREDLSTLLKLESFEKMEDDVLLLKYSVKK
ncbi:dihydrofolate reductase family protein [Flavobacterium silvaticum]|uniref:RibD family protein n=1 Tax=Flavobacterium silvaticum TaxID=1852020 RepID=A0A972FNT5_9FLAO|nr:RibD family protein [Flavobacterium silvaticum]NMH29087.1 RibD family protein [Flavobacterium silvaticum]